MPVTKGLKPSFRAESCGKTLEDAFPLDWQKDISPRVKTLSSNCYRAQKVLY